MFEDIQVKFASTEKDFAYSEGVNRGHIIVYTKINRCLFLSSEAKQLYHNICEYAYGDKRECFPSQVTLMMELGWRSEKLNKYMDELRDKKLIATKRLTGKPLTYYISEIHTVPVLAHSELVYGVKESFRNRKDFYDALIKYKKSELFNKVSNSANPLEFEKDIYNWFGDYFREKEMREAFEKEEPSKQLPNVKAFQLGEVQRESSIEGTKRRRKRVTYKDVPVSEWNAEHFYKYFCDLYREKFNGLAYPPMNKLAELGAIKNLMVTRDNNEVVKSHMEIFIELDFFDRKNINGFVSSYVQQVLDTYVTTGKLPNYNSSKGNVTNLDGDGEWLDEVGKLFD